VTIEIDEITDKLFESINKMYDVGAKNILILSIFNKNCVLNNSHYLNDDIIRFNNNIIKKSEQLFNEHLDFNFIIYNAFGKLKDIYSNCNMYNFKDCNNMWKNNKKNNLTDYLWFDSHLTDHGNKILAEDINDLLNSLNH